MLASLLLLEYTQHAVTTGFYSGCSLCPERTSLDSPLVNSAPSSLIKWHLLSEASPEPPWRILQATPPYNGPPSPLSMLCCLSVQFSSVAQSCPTLCDPMNRSTPGLPVHHQLPEFTQTHVHRVHDAIQPSHPPSSPSPPAPSPSQHQSLFQ